MKKLSLIILGVIVALSGFAQNQDKKSKTEGLKKVENFSSLSQLSELSQLAKLSELSELASLSELAQLSSLAELTSLSELSSLSTDEEVINLSAVEVLLDDELIKLFQSLGKYAEYAEYRSYGNFEEYSSYLRLVDVDILSKEIVEGLEGSEELNDDNIVDFEDVIDRVKNATKIPKEE